MDCAARQLPRRVRTLSSRESAASRPALELLESSSVFHQKHSEDASALSQPLGSGLLGELPLLI